MSSSIAFISSIKKILNDYLSTYIDVAVSSRASATDYTDTRAGYLDNIQYYTDTRAGYIDELAAANIPADVDTLLSRTTTLTNLDAAVSTRASASDMSTLLNSRLTPARAGYLDYLNATISSRLSTLSFQAFTTNGTWTKPSNVGWVFVLLVGGGGGGFRDCGGGGGQVLFRFVPVTGNVSVTIGAGGTGAGTDGGNSTFGSLLTALGGAGGSTASSGVGAAGGGMIRATPGQSGEGSIGGAQGGGGGYTTTVGGCCPGFGIGGSGSYGGGGGSYGNGGNSSGGTANANSGGGGGGCSGSLCTGGSGGSGYCVVYWIQ